MVRSFCNLNESSVKLEDDNEERAKSMRFRVPRSDNEDHITKRSKFCYCNCVFK